MEFKNFSSFSSFSSLYNRTGMTRIIDKRKYFFFLRFIRDIEKLSLWDTGQTWTNVDNFFCLLSRFPPFMFRVLN